MKKMLYMVPCLLVLMSFIKWEPDFNKAKQIAGEKHELILLNFSGSDWSRPCKKLRKEFFGSKVFSQLADTNLILVNADFPKDKRNQLDAQAMKQNNTLAAKYNPAGKFRYTLLLDSKGNVLKIWDGLPNESAEQFSAEIKNIVYNSKQF
ncbi:MAG: thioredoxin family protein [Bacteroidota bacterium]|nr:thioredoxin family protein [Bacteroidota bacterium]